MVHNIPRLQEVPPLAKAIAAKFGALPQVVAVALAGSRTSGTSNEASDYDFYLNRREDPHYSWKGIYRAQRVPLTV